MPELRRLVSAYGSAVRAVEALGLDAQPRGLVAADSCHRTAWHPTSRSIPDHGICRSTARGRTIRVATHVCGARGTGVIDHHHNRFVNGCCGDVGGARPESLVLAPAAGNADRARRRLCASGCICELATLAELDVHDQIPSLHCVVRLWHGMDFPSIRLATTACIIGWMQ